MAMVNKTRNMLEGLVKEGSFKWLTKRQSAFDEDIEDMERSPSAGKNWLPELSLTANVVVRRCSKLAVMPSIFISYYTNRCRILGLSLCQLRENFDAEVSDFLKHQSSFARNFLEYCCFLALAWSIHVNGYLDDKKFWRLTFDMMVAWEFPEASSEPYLHADDDVTVGVEAFSRIAPAVPVVADVVVSGKIFLVLAGSSSSGLVKWDVQLSCVHLSAYDSHHSLLEVSFCSVHICSNYHWYMFFRAIRRLQSQSESYDLADDLQQVVKPELTGPCGIRLFDKAVFYKSSALLEPVVVEFPELKGHTRRDYWLAIIREALYAHRFVLKFRISGLEREEVLLKAIFGIMRVQALKEMSFTQPLCLDALLMFNVCDQLPLGDLILEELVNTLASGKVDKKNAGAPRNGVYSSSALSIASNLGFSIGKSWGLVNGSGPVVGEITVGEMTPLEKGVKEARCSYENVVLAQATVDGVKVDGIDTSLAVMKSLFLKIYVKLQEVLSPMTEIWNWLVFLFSWEEPSKSLAFCLVFTCIICKGWMSYALAALFILFAVFMLLTRYFGQGMPMDELKVTGAVKIKSWKLYVPDHYHLGYRESCYRISGSSLASRSFTGLIYFPVGFLGDIYAIFTNPKTEHGKMDEKVKGLVV
ncbi:hypothetical protein SASPL_136259 [Salvia splendens]|uniref:Uncharacterized protein n=1 Tax=Salvia splendens TaxID=180675 RepID=A0A8X8ZGQ1_SALSN|nr:hypothetical protein SASPL_136259 [Salvia splendens]